MALPLTSSQKLPRSPTSSPTSNSFPFHCNIPSGPGMAWAIRNQCFSQPFLDSDDGSLTSRMLEDLANNWTPSLRGRLDPPISIDWRNSPKSLPSTWATVHACVMSTSCASGYPNAWGAHDYAHDRLAESGQSALVHHVDWIENGCTHDGVKRFMRRELARNRATYVRVPL